MKTTSLFFVFIAAVLSSYGQDSALFKPTVWEPNNIPASKAIKYMVDTSIKDSVNFYVKPDMNTNYQLMTIGQKKRE